MRILNLAREQHRTGGFIFDEENERTVSVEDLHTVTTELVDQLDLCGVK